ncbi:MAG: hypothetical protein WCI02_02735 [Planctomycetota bacterium]
MAYDVNVQINLTIADGPGPFKGNFKLMGITDTNAKKISFIPTDKKVRFSIGVPKSSDDKDKPGVHEIEYRDRVLQCKKIHLQVPTGGTLAFVAIKAPAYTFKQCPTGDVSGVGLHLTHLQYVQKDAASAPALSAQDGDATIDLSKLIWIKNDYILISFCPDDTLAHSKWLSIFLDPAMFDCSKDTTKPFDVTITYGVRGGHGDPEPEDCCGENIKATALQQARNRHFVNA